MCVCVYMSWVMVDRSTSLTSMCVCVCCGSVCVHLAHEHVLGHSQLVRLLAGLLLPLVVMVIVRVVIRMCRIVNFL